MNDKYIKLTDWNEMVKAFNEGVCYIKQCDTYALKTIDYFSTDNNYYKLNPDYKEDTNTNPFLICLDCLKNGNENCNPKDIYTCDNFTHKEDTKSCDNCGHRKKHSDCNYVVACDNNYSHWTPIQPLGGK